MWKRVAGVAVVLLAVGAAGGYVAADRTQPEPVALDLPQPVPAVSPAVPTPPAVSLLPDPSTPALAPSVPLERVELRSSRRGPGLAVEVPVGWVVNKELEGDPVWNVGPPESLNYTYKLRIAFVAGAHQAVGVAKMTRKAELASAEDNNDISDVTYLAETEEAFIATYVQGDHLRVTMERWLTRGSETAYADISVTGRKVDQDGLSDLLDRVAASAEPLDALPKEEKSASSDATPETDAP
jgi:hypothetical protein